MPKHPDHLDRLFHSLADPTRRAILARLVQGPARVSDLAAPFAMALPSVLQHLQRLEDAGLIVTARQGRERICTIRPGALGPAHDWLQDQRTLWEGRTDRLDNYLAELTGRNDA